MKARRHKSKMSSKKRGKRLLKAWVKKLHAVWNNAPPGYRPGPLVGRLIKDPDWKPPPKK
jgi:hypothetical protein